MAYTYQEKDFDPFQNGFAYQENSEFNSEDTYEFYVFTHNAYITSQCHFEKGFWWTNEGLNYKCHVMPVRKVLK